MLRDSTKRKGKYDEDLQFGRKFGRLTSLGPVRSTKSQREYLFACECGAITWQPGASVVRGNTLSCGCYARDAAATRCKSRAKHGLSTSAIYNVWHSMMVRCYYKEAKSYRFYGALGISVCDRWHTFEPFYEDVGPMWVKGLQIDRIDNLGNYAPGNIRFVTVKENQRNRKDNRNIEIDGVTKCASEWAEEYGIKATLFLQRIDRDNMDPKQALTYKKYKEDENGIMRKQRKIHREEGGSIPKRDQQNEPELPAFPGQPVSKKLLSCATV